MATSPNNGDDFSGRLPSPSISGALVPPLSLSPPNGPSRKSITEGGTLPANNGGFTVRHSNGNQDRDLETMVNDMIPAQKQALLLRYIEATNRPNDLLDEMLHSLMKNIPAPDAKRIAHEVETDRIIARAMPLREATVNSPPPMSVRDKKKSLLRPVDVTSEFENQILQREMRKFWFEGISKAKTDPTNAQKTGELAIVSVFEAEPEEDERTKQSRQLASYVPKLVLRRLLSEDPTIQCAEMEGMVAAVFFADISGFTPLTEKLASLGKNGIEKLTSVLNSYFGRLIDCIHIHCGDIIKFAGDALLVVWPIPMGGSLSGAVLLACQCAKALVKDLGNYSVEDTGSVLRLHIGVGAGEIAGICVGGVENKMEYFVSGTVLEQVSSCEKQAAPGEVYVSALAWMLAPGRLSGVQKGKAQLSNWRLDDILQPIDLPDLIQLPIHPEMNEHLQAFVPPAVQEHISRNMGGWLAELRHVSVIFVSLTVAFKEYRLGELQSAVSSMQNIIFRLEGMVRQFMIDDKGSVLIAGWGLPQVSHEDDAPRAVQAAIEIHGSLAKLGIPVSIGVTTGKAFCGDVGSSQRREYAMVGDIVNLSARLMIAAHSNILTDFDTYDACRSFRKLAFKKLEDIRVKGKLNPISVYQPSRRKGPGKDPTIRTVKTRLHRNDQMARSLISVGFASIVGRAEEMSLINDLSLALRERSIGITSPRTLIIEGLEGVGKTKLVRYFEGVMKESNNNGASNKSLVLIGTADQLNNSTAYHVWQDIFSHLLDGQTNKLPRAVLANIDPETLPLLNPILMLGVPDTKTTEEMAPQKKVEVTLSLLLHLLKMIATPGTCIIVDNAHFMDSASWSLALNAISQLESVLFILATRPVRGVTQFSQIQHRPDTTMIRLGNLNMEEVAKLMLIRLNVKKIADKVIGEVYRKGQGNPFITEQLLDVMMQAAEKTVASGDITMNAEVEQALQQVPDSISQLLTSKIDKLQPEDRNCLKIASIIGVNFTEKMLFRLMNTTDIDAARSTLIRAKQAGFVVDQEGEAGNWSFTNILLREVIFDIMLSAQRKDIHLKIVQIYLEGEVGNSSNYPMIAYHYKAAEEKEKALEYFSMAGSSYLNEYRNSEAVTFLSEAAELSLQLGRTFTLERIALIRKLASAYHNLGRFDRADEEYRRAMDLMGISIPHQGSKIKALKKVYNLTFSRPSSCDVSELFHRKREAVLIFLGLVKVNYFECNRDVAHFCSSTALDISEDLEDDVLRSEALAMSSLTYAVVSDYRTADAFFQKALRASSQVEDKRRMVSQIGGMMLLSRGDWETSEDYFIKALEASKACGDLRSLEETNVFLGTMYYLEGDLYKSISHSAEALYSAQSRSDVQSQILAYNALARSYFSIGDFGKTQQYLNEASAVFESGFSNDLSSEMNYMVTVALMNFITGNYIICQKNAETALLLLQRREPTCFFTFSAYAGLVEVFVLILSHLHATGAGKTQKSRIMSRAEKAIGLLNKFAQLFPFALPRLDMWKAALTRISNNNKTTSKEEKEWTKALEGARRLKMRYDESLILFERGKMQGIQHDMQLAIQTMPFIQARSRELNDFEKQKLYGLNTNAPKNLASSIRFPASALPSTTSIGSLDTMSSMPTSPIVSPLIRASSREHKPLVSPSFSNPENEEEEEGTPNNRASLVSSPDERHSRETPGEDSGIIDEVS